MLFLIKIVNEINEFNDQRFEMQIIESQLNIISSKGLKK